MAARSTLALTSSTLAFPLVYLGPPLAGVYEL